MDDPYWQRAPEPGWTRVRIRERLWEMPDPEWERRVRLGQIPGDALVLSRHWTRGVWKRASQLEVYHLFAPAAALPEQSPGPSLPAAGRAGPDADGLPRALWGPGISVTQVLVLANLLISAALVWAWREDYSEHLWAFSGRLKAGLEHGAAPVLLVPLFLHASAPHLLSNMMGLAAAGAAVEQFYGAWRTSLLYLWAGLCGAAFSLLRVKPVLSVGASGAIMGLYGVILVFLLRYRERFPDRQRRKALRVYLPLLVIALLPSLFMADLLSHVGGFLGGCLLGLVLPPSSARTSWMTRSAESRPDASETQTR